MSGLALVCARLGAEVTGIDRAESSYMERLRAAGLEPRLGHDADQVPADAEVVVSTAIRRGQPRAGAGPRARPAGHPPRRAAGRALRRASPARGRRHPRQDDHRRDVHLGAARHRRRPGLLPRRRAAGLRPGRRGHQRRLGRGRVGRRRGRRERRELPGAAARDRGDHQPRARPPLALELARRAAPRPSPPSPRRPRASSRAPTCGCPARRRSASRASPSSRRRGACAGRRAARDRNRDPAGGWHPLSRPGRRDRRRGQPEVPGRHNVATRWRPSAVSRWRGPTSRAAPRRSPTSRASRAGSS